MRWHRRRLCHYYATSALCVCSRALWHCVKFDSFNKIRVHFSFAHSLSRIGLHFPSFSFHILLMGFPLQFTHWIFRCSIYFISFIFMFVSTSFSRFFCSMHGNFHPYEKMSWSKGKPTNYNLTKFFVQYLVLIDMRLFLLIRETLFAFFPFYFILFSCLNKANSSMKICLQ